MRHDLLIFGASARAAAFSALRCGLRPFCGDYFADRDLAAVCTVERIDPADAGRQYVALAESLPPSPWFYTGGFENHPEWVDQISRRHRLWGNEAPALRAIRDPVRVARVLGEAGIDCPAVSLDPRGLPLDGSWLAKPLASGGGRGIEPLIGPNSPDSTPRYYQRRIDGPSFSALFVAQGHRSRLIGVTRQWIGVPESPFGYRGSCGPWPIAESVSRRLRAMGDVLASAFDLLGWFGVDYVLDGEIPWPVEINPRYTASVEIHELAMHEPLLMDHRRACEGAGDHDSHSIDPDRRSPRLIAKLILHATRRLAVPEVVADEDRARDLFDIPTIADLPRPGILLDPGEPVMTLFASGTDPASCRARLLRAERRWEEQLGSMPSGRQTREI